MRAAAALALPALAACAGAPPPLMHPAGAEAPGGLAASFSARVAGPGGAARLRGSLAAAPGGRIRVEVASAAPGGALVLVATPDGTLAWLMGGGLYHAGGPEEPVLARLTGLDVAAASIADILLGKEDDPPPGCAARLSSWRGGAWGRAAARARIRCGGSELTLRLSGLRPLSAHGGADPFSLRPPGAGYREAGLAEILAAAGGAGEPVEPAADPGRAP